MTTSTGETGTNVGPQPTRGAIPADTFAARLRLVRMHAGDLTIIEAAERTGLNYGSWSNWERGIQPRDKADIVRAIADGLGIDQNWLMWGGQLAPEPRRRARGGSIATRPKGLTFRDPGVTAYKRAAHGPVRHPVRPADRRTPGSPAQTPAHGRPVRLSRPDSR